MHSFSANPSSQKSSSPNDAREFFYGGQLWTYSTYAEVDKSMTAALESDAANTPAQIVNIIKYPSIRPPVLPDAPTLTGENTLDNPK